MEEVKVDEWGMGDKKGCSGERGRRQKWSKGAWETKSSRWRKMEAVKVDEWVMGDKKGRMGRDG